MKIAIVGMGVAGSYLASRLSREHKVVCFERLAEDKFDAVCAWGTSKGGIDRFTKNCGLNFDDYILFDGKEMRVDLGKKSLWIKLKGLCTFDKHAFVRDMAEREKISYGKQVTQLPQSEDFDMVVDATGLTRPLLPRINHDIWIPCVQYKVKIQDPPYDDFYIKPLSGLSGYFWYFPLGDGYAHVGAGDYYKKHNEEIQRFLHSNRCEVVKKVGRPVRITPPNRCEPFYVGKVVGVGESIGTVYPMLGEGIIPSLQCADMLAANLHDLSNYRTEVLKRFRIFDEVFSFIRSKIEGDFSLVSQFPTLFSVFVHMKSNEYRYGMKIRLADFLKVAREGRTLLAS